MGHMAAPGWEGELAAGALVALLGILSFGLRLNLGRRMLVASLRAIVQLWLVGLVLRWIFLSESSRALLIVLPIMLLTASHAGVARLSSRYTGAWLDSALAIGLSSGLVVIYALSLVVRPEPWHSAREVLPLVGMILGNSLSGISLALERFVSDAQDRREEIESRFSHGATRWEASQPLVREALKTGMTPILNAMTVAGVVSLPGALTGQLLAGAEPMLAVRYQAILLLLLASATLLGSLGAVLLAWRRVFHAEHRLLRVAL